MFTEPARTTAIPLPQHVVPARVNAAFSAIQHCQNIRLGLVTPEGDVIMEGRKLTTSESALHEVALRRITQFLTGEDLP